MKTTFPALLAGLIFGLGLLLSGMANPEKVLGFLDIAGAWDPSLALVMAGAIAVSLPAFQLFKGRSQSLLKQTIQLPTNNHIDRRLLIGGLMFGAGWGLAGFCPGPAIVASGAGQEKALIFTLAMLAGMGIFRLSARKMVPAQG
ncbi:YeeE/YedE family protein [Microbulbifer variabilis]|uniref:YeeE/YedE family protein n=1 Tax=Microbulbifer variabilis TaxID=266805 RepID=A0ABY4V781_9GAMM|nr:YeeE/YedE family protein [Microbulbifer variabilis]USD20119.1 YeeE/YedE family protein [Microbulbifer variabilis]